MGRLLTAELMADLDLLVARAEGMDTDRRDDGVYARHDDSDPWTLYQPTLDRTQAYALMHKLGLALVRDEGAGTWAAADGEKLYHPAPSPLVAICIAAVARLCPSAC